jgi:hypothetical protein
MPAYANVFHGLKEGPAMYIQRIEVEAPVQSIEQRLRCRGHGVVIFPGAFRAGDSHQTLQTTVL